MLVPFCLQISEKKLLNHNIFWWKCNNNLLTHSMPYCIHEEIELDLMAPFPPYIFFKYNIINIFSVAPAYMNEYK